MGRISLATKLKKRSDFSTILEKLKLAPNKAKFLVDQFNVSLPSAYKAVLELELPSEMVEAIASDKNLLFAKTFIYRLENNLKEYPSTLMLVKFASEIKKTNINVLKLIFKEFSGLDSTSSNKNKLVEACRYLAQIKYYKLIWRVDIPEWLLIKSQERIKECQ